MRPEITHAVGDRDAWSVQRIERLTIYLSISAIAIALYLWPSFATIGGLVIGAAISLANFRLISRSVAKMFAENERASKNGLRYGIKVLALIALVGVLIIGFKMDAVAFVIGFSTLVVAIIYEGIRTLF